MGLRVRLNKFLGQTPPSTPQCLAKQAHAVLRAQQQEIEQLPTKPTGVRGRIDANRAALRVVRSRDK